MTTTTTTTSVRPGPSIPGRSTERRASDRTSGWPLGVRWAVTGLAFPPAGLLAVTIAPVTSVPAGLVAGAAAGTVIGAGQWLALRRVVPPPSFAGAWIAATAASISLGVAAGAAAVGFATATADLVAMGLVTGAVLGVVQAVLLGRAGLVRRSGAVAWAAATPLLWALGWFVTASAGVDVERHYTNFGLLGSMTAAALGGALLGRLTRSARA